MRALHAFIGGVAALNGLSLHAMAMGSGPHPYLPYGILPPAHDSPGDSFWQMPIFWLIATVVVAGLLIGVLRVVGRK
jgi:hypothetical protein